MLSFTALATDITAADAYALARGWGNWEGVTADKNAALRRGQDYIAGTYNARWAAIWANASAPEGVRFAIIEAARRELVEPGVMSPDQARGGRIKAVAAGSVNVTYMDGADADTVFKSIAGLLAGLIVSDTRVMFLERA